jgi:hydrogenase-4 component B
MTFASLHFLLLLSIIWPLFLFFLLAFKKIHSKLRYLLPSAALPALALALISPDTVIVFKLDYLLVGSTYVIDAISKIFLLLAAILWSFSAAYASAYFQSQETQINFFRFYLLAMIGNFVLILAEDLASFYLGFTLMSFASYALVVFNKDTAALKAGLVYIILVVISEVILFAAILMAINAVDGMTFKIVREQLLDAPNHNLIIFLAFIGFGIKAGILGVHVWLPLAHPVAPTPASAVLSGTMIKAGVLGWLRFFPLGVEALPEWGTAMIILGSSASIYGVVIGLTQRDPKVVLAYSSISQMGVMTMAIGLGMHMPELWSVMLLGILFFIFHHGLSKAALFLGVGLFGNSDYQQRFWIWIGIWLPALAISGAPWTSGMLAKGMLKEYASYTTLSPSLPLGLFLTVSSIATTLLMIRLLYLLRPSAKPYGSKPRVGTVFVWSLLLCIILLTPWFLGYSFKNLTAIQVFASLWPIIVSFIIALFIIKTQAFRNLQGAPAGDILVLYERSFCSLFYRVHQLKILGKYSRNVSDYCKEKMFIFFKSTQIKMKQTELLVSHWKVTMIFIVIIMTTLGLFSSPLF